MIGKRKPGSVFSLFDNSMTPARFTIALMFLLFVVLLSTGCVGQPPMEKPATNSTVAVSGIPTTGTTNLTTPVETACPLLSNGSFWIKIDPVGTIKKGDRFRINGTTHIASGKTLELMIAESSYHSARTCNFDDYLRSVVKVWKGDGCINSLSLYFDSTNFQSKEYFISATYPENTSVTNYQIFNLSKNTTPLVFPNDSTIKNNSTNVSFALLPISDVKSGDIQIVQGVRKGIQYDIIYSIREAGYTQDCVPISPWCQGVKIYGIISPLTSGPDSSQFAIRFDTTDLEPGQYVIDLDFTCSGAVTKGWFNVT